MVRDLTKKQERELVDFLKRWGLDHPLLIQEMLDHYSEKAIYAMEEGFSWERTLQSWKTKSTFLAFRRMDKEFTEQQEKYWNRIQRKHLYKLITHKNVLFLALIAVFCHTVVLSKLGLLFLAGLFALKCIAAFAAMVVQVVRKRTRHILSIRNMSFYYIFYVLMAQVAFRTISIDEGIWTITQNPQVLAIFFWISIAADFYSITLWKRVKMETNSLTLQMLEDHIPKLQTN